MVGLPAVQFIIEKKPKALPKTIGTVDSSLADDSCFSETNVGHCERSNLLPFLST